MPTTRPLPPEPVLCEMLDDLTRELLGSSVLAAQTRLSNDLIAWVLFAGHRGVDELDQAFPTEYLVHLLERHAPNLVGYDDELLAMARLVRSFAADDQIALDIVDDIETMVIARGATAPDWTRRVDEWDLTEAWLTPTTSTPLASDYASELVLGWRHACGDEHCLVVASDPSSRHHIDSIETYSSVRDVVAGMHRAYGRMSSAFGDGSGTVALEPISPAAASELLYLAIRTTERHDFLRLRNNLPAASLYALLKSRLACLPAVP